MSNPTLLAAAAPRCRWCGSQVVQGPHGWLDDKGSYRCEIYLDGCRSCMDGESHPHEGVEPLVRRRLPVFYSLDPEALDDLAGRDLSDGARRCLLAATLDAPDHSALIELIDHIAYHEPDWAPEHSIQLTEAISETVRCAVHNQANELETLAGTAILEARIVGIGSPAGVAYQMLVEFTAELTAQLRDIDPDGFIAELAARLREFEPADLPRPP